jgi:hypothetical protein
LLRVGSAVGGLGGVIVELGIDTGVAGIAGVVSSFFVGVVVVGGGTAFVVVTSSGGDAVSFTPFVPSAICASIDAVLSLREEEDLVRECEGVWLLLSIENGTLSDGLTIESPTASDTRFRLGRDPVGDFSADVSLPSADDPDDDVR